MKLRCTANSIRLRLRKSELQSLALHKKIEEAVAFPSGTQLTYSLVIDGKESIHAHFDKSTMCISIPQHQADAWINSSAVSLETTVDLPQDEVLSILIEKDFPCKDREEENKEDTFWELSEDNQSC